MHCIFFGSPVVNWHYIKRNRKCCTKRNGLFVQAYNMLYLNKSWIIYLAIRSKTSIFLRSQTRTNPYCTWFPRNNGSFLLSSVPFFDEDSSEKHRKIIYHISACTTYTTQFSLKYNILYVCTKIKNFFVKHFRNTPAILMLSVGCVGWIVSFFSGRVCGKSFFLFSSEKLYVDSVPLLSQRD